MSISSVFTTACVHPLLAASDISLTLAWYERCLEFPRTRNFGDYGIAQKGAVELHFWQCSERHIAENTSCYIELESPHQIDDLYDQLKQKQDEFAPGRLSEPPKTYGHGMREFYVWDPDGNLLRFGADTNEE